MKDERTALRKTFRSRQRPVMRYLIAAGLLLAVVAAGVSWTITDIHRAEYSPNARLIRTQLEESIREAYDRETAEAGKLRDGKERQKALRDAAQARDQRLAEGDDFIRSITLTIVRGQASPELLELARILEEQGVKAALDYLSSQESRLLDQTSQLAQCTKDRSTPRSACCWKESACTATGAIWRRQSACATSCWPPTPTRPQLLTSASGQ